MKKILKYLLVYVCIALLFLALMIATYLLPNNRIRAHVVESVDILKQEGIGYSPFFFQGGSTLDTHTDALILNIALNQGMNESNIKNAVENSFYEDETRQGVSSLEAALQDGIINNHEYSRYWHGIQVIIRPLLLFFNYSEIRYIIMIVTFCLLGIVFSMIGKELGLRYSIAFSITISLMYIVLIPMSIQYSSIFIISLIAMIAVMLLYKMNKQKYINILFFVIGAFTTFFDLLTYPIVTLAFPIILAVIYENKNGKNLLQQLLFTIRLGVLWAIGYALLFFTKWLIASIILNKDAITLAINELLFRVNGNEKYPVSRIDAVKGNFDYFFVPIAKYMFLIIIVVWCILFAVYRKKIKECKVIIPLMCIAIVPYIWYILFAGHSSIHSFFTNRIQAMTVFALLCSMAETINFDKISRKDCNKK